MELAPLWLAIKARAQADTGTGGLFNVASPLIANIYPDKAPPDQTAPWVIVSAIISEQDDTFKGDVVLGQVRLHIYVTESDASGDPWQRMGDIEKRLYGDSSAGGVPTYGFHRHLLTFTSGSWTPTKMRRIGTHPEPEETEVIHYVQTYELYGSR